jgi:hypothetical protein
MPVAPPRTLQTATYAPLQPAPWAPTPGAQQNPYGGSPQPYQQTPGAQAAQSINPALAGSGSSVDPSAVAGVPNPDVLSELLRGTVQPALANEASQIDLAQAGSTITQQQISDAIAQQRQEAGFSLGQLGIQGSNLDLQRQALEAQAGPGGFQQQQRELTAAEEAQQFARNKRSLYGQFATSGSTGGNQVQSWSDLLKGYGFQQQQLALQGKEQQQAYQTAKAQMANAAKSLGISEAEVKARLDNAISQLGLSRYMDANQLALTIAGIKAGTITGVMAQVAQQVLQLSGFPIQSFGGY